MMEIMEKNRANRACTSAFVMLDILGIVIIGVEYGHETLVFQRFDLNNRAFKVRR